MTEPNPKKPSPRPARRRARKPDGKFKGDNPATPDVNEAWEPIDVAPALPKQENKYAPKPKVTGMSNDSGGKYSKDAKVTRPGVGKVTTTYN